MNDHGNHYDLLGLDVSAPTQVVRTAVDRLAERANAMAYSSPERSHELWSHIRIVRGDLLSGHDRRAAYDAQILSSGRTASSRPVVLPPVPAAAVYRSGRRHADSARRWLALSGVVLAALVASAIALFPSRPAVHSPSLRVAMALAASGPRHGAAFVSGQRDSLTWTLVPGATHYLVQIATSPVLLGKAALATHPHQNRYTRENTLTLTVVGAQLYYWRVRPYVAGRWGAYTRWQHFAVARPVIGLPDLRSPPDGTMRVASHMTLCWAAVDGGVGYRLRINGIAPRRSARTCDTVRVRPGTYRWSVAALVRGVRVYQGAYSTTAVFTVLPKRVLVAQRMLPRKRAPSGHNPGKRRVTSALSPPRTAALLLRPVRGSSHSRISAVVSGPLPYARPVQRTPRRSVSRARSPFRSSYGVPVRTHRSGSHVTRPRRLPGGRPRTRVAGFLPGSSGPGSSPAWTVPPISAGSPTSMPLADSAAVTAPVTSQRGSLPVTVVPLPAGQGPREATAPPAGKVLPYPAPGRPSVMPPVTCSRRGCVAHP